MSQTRQTPGLTTSTAHFNASRAGNSPSIKALQLEYSRLQKEPVEGFTVKLDEDSNLYKWHGTYFLVYFPHYSLLIIPLYFSWNFWTTRYSLCRWIFQS